MLLLHRLLLRRSRRYRRDSVSVHPGCYVRQSLIFNCELKPPLGFGAAQERSLLSAELRVTPIAIFIGHVFPAFVQ